MTRTARRAATAALAVAALLALAGCNSAPGAAAVVGSDAISTDRLTSFVSLALDNPQARSRYSGDLAGFTRQELGQLINDRVVQATADRYGVTVTNGDVQQRIDYYAQQAGGLDQLRQQAAQVGVPPSHLTDFVRTLVLSDAIADKLTAGTTVPAATLRNLYQQNIDQYDQVHTAELLVTSKALADRLLAEARAHPSRFPALVQQYSTDTNTKAAGGDIGYQGRGQLPTPYADAVFAAKPGSFVEVHTQDGYYVVHVIDRRTLSLADATPDLRRQALKSQRDQALGNALAQEAARLHVRVNPRFGRWDPRQRAVVAPADVTSSPSPGPANAAPFGGAPQG